MKTIKSVAVGCMTVAALTLVGCGTVATAGPSDDETFIAALDRGAVPHHDDQQAINLGRGACTQFDAGASLVGVGFTAMSAGLTPEQAGYLIGSAVGVYCPEHIGVIEAAGTEG